MINRNPIYWCSRLNSFQRQNFDVIWTEIFMTSVLCDLSCAKTLSRSVVFEKYSYRTHFSLLFFLWSIWHMYCPLDPLLDACASYCMPLLVAMSTLWVPQGLQYISHQRKFLWFITFYWKLSTIILRWELWVGKDY